MIPDIQTSFRYRLKKWIIVTFCVIYVTNKLLIICLIIKSSLDYNRNSEDYEITTTTTQALSTTPITPLLLPNQTNYVCKAVHISDNSDDVDRLPSKSRAALLTAAVISITVDMIGLIGAYREHRFLMQTYTEISALSLLTNLIAKQFLSNIPLAVLHISVTVVTYLFTKDIQLASLQKQQLLESSRAHQT